MGMADSILFMAFFAIAPLFTGVMLWLAFRHAKKTGATIEVFARELGLDVRKKPPVLGIFQGLPEVVGERQGRQVRIYQFPKGSGKNSQTWSALVMGRVRSTNLQVTLSGQGAYTKFRSFFGAEEIEVEDRASNDRWFIETNDPTFLQVALFGKACAAIDATQSDGRTPKGRFRLKDGEMRYEEKGSLSDADRRERMELAITAGQELLDVAAVHADQRTG